MIQPLRQTIRSFLQIGDVLQFWRAKRGWVTPLLVLSASLVISGTLFSPSSWADSPDPYVRRYLGVQEPVAIQLNSQGETRLFSAAQLSAGKRFFEENCKNCHVGGATLPDPTVSLALSVLQAATPPRENVLSLVSFLRQPMTYDGTEETYSCRPVAESWLSDQAAANLAAFILRSAEKAPGWGNTTF